MYTLKVLPKSYKSLESLIICSNNMIGGGFPFSLGDGLPVIIGMGEEPIVWLQAIKNHETKKLFLLVDANISTVKEISVTKPKEGVIEIFYNGEYRILRVEKLSDTSAEISYLDLKPLGLNISGDQNALTVGGSSFSNNTFSGSSVFMGLG